MPKSLINGAYICEICGSVLDAGEKCDCQGRETENIPQEDEKENSITDRNSALEAMRKCLIKTAESYYADNPALKRAFLERSGVEV